MKRRFTGPIFALTLQPRPGQREIRFRPGTPREMGRPRQQADCKEESHVCIQPQKRRAHGPDCAL